MGKLLSSSLLKNLSENYSILSSVISLFSLSFILFAITDMIHVQGQFMSIGCKHAYLGKSCLLYFIQLAGICDYRKYLISLFQVSWCCKFTETVASSFHLWWEKRILDTEVVGWFGASGLSQWESVSCWRWVTGSMDPCWFKNGPAKEGSSLGKTTKAVENP